MASGVHFPKGSGMASHVLAPEKFAPSKDAERLETDREQVPYASSVGAIRGFMAVIVIYIILAALGYGGFLLWSWLH